MQTYLFYDIETTGLNKSFDQILQFAAIRTDLNLKELERHELKIKLNADVIPSPKALITHHIGVKEAQQGITEVDAIKQIHRWMNEPGTTSLGYNTLGFDDEFLRFSFYRNLFKPYTHQYENQCGRMDIYPMTLMYFLFRKHILNWPEKAGKFSFKLEDLNLANQLAPGRAHHAMVDVEATLALAQRFFNERDFWEYVSGYFNKSDDIKRCNVPQNTQALMVYGKFGSEQNFLCPVLYLGSHRKYKHQIWLRLDLDNLTQTTTENIKETTWTVRKKYGEPGFILPIKDRYLAHLNSKRVALAESNKKWLDAHPDLFNHIVNFHINDLYPDYPEKDIEACLYNGFWSDEDYHLCRRFHLAEPKEKSSIIDASKNKTLKQLAIRVLGRNYSEMLSPEQTEYFDQYIQQIKTQTIIDFRGEQRLTAKRALDEILALRNQEQLSSVQIELLDELEKYLVTF